MRQPRDRFQITEAAQRSMIPTGHVRHKGSAEDFRQVYVRVRTRPRELMLLALRLDFPVMLVPRKPSPGGSVLSFRILGPLEIVTGARVLRPRGSKQNALLMTLLASPGQLVSAEALIVELWGDEHPGGVENDLHAHISRLRRRLSAMEPGTIDSRVVTHVSGYELVVGDEELDAASFVRGLEELRGVVRADSAEFVRRVRRLLGLWRGQAFGSQDQGPILQAASARYEEHRIAAYQLLFDHELRSGNHSKIIPELHGLLARYEFHEQFWQQLMVALYRSGRQTDALNVYRELERRLSDQLGLDPSPTMRQYEQAVLNHHPSINHNLQVSYVGA
jgi:SARP family transcriptional regulator, regulator of embCAB operon